MRHMKQILITFFLLCYSGILLLGESVQLKNHQIQDSSSYESQRQRVNDLLEQRSKKFGQYTESLEQKTGIFGLFKRKADMQRSIDILREIVLSDNHIFIETQKLIALKDSQRERYQNLAAEFDQQISAHMKTITKLQNENEKLHQQLENASKTDRGIHLFSYVSLIAILALIVVVFLQRRSLKSKN